MKNSNLAAVISVLLLSVLNLATAAEMRKINNITADSNPLILLEKFAFTSSGGGVLNISVSNVSFSSSVDPSLVGFFLVSSSNLFDALYHLQNPNPKCNPKPCILSSPNYTRLLFTFSDLPNFNSYNHSFPVSNDDEYILALANCNNPIQAVVSMSVVTSMCNSRPNYYWRDAGYPVPFYQFAFVKIFLAYNFFVMYVLIFHMGIPFWKDKTEQPSLMPYYLTLASYAIILLSFAVYVLNFFNKQDEASTCYYAP